MLINLNQVKKFNKGEVATSSGSDGSIKNIKESLKQKNPPEKNVNNTKPRTASPAGNRSASTEESSIRSAVSDNDPMEVTPNDVSDFGEDLGINDNFGIDVGKFINDAHVTLDESGVPTIENESTELLDKDGNSLETTFDELGPEQEENFLALLKEYYKKEKKEEIDVAPESAVDNSETLDVSEQDSEINPTLSSSEDKSDSDSSESHLKVERNESKLSEQLIVDLPDLDPSVASLQETTEEELRQLREIEDRKRNIEDYMRDMQDEETALERMNNQFEIQMHMLESSRQEMMKEIDEQEKLRVSEPENYKGIDRMVALSNRENKLDSLLKDYDNFRSGFEENAEDLQLEIVKAQSLVEESMDMEETPQLIERREKLLKIIDKGNKNLYKETPELIERREKLLKITDKGNKNLNNAQKLDKEQEDLAFPVFDEGISDVGKIENGNNPPSAEIPRRAPGHERVNNGPGISGP